MKKTMIYLSLLCMLAAVALPMVACAPKSNDTGMEEAQQGEMMQEGAQEEMGEGMQEGMEDMQQGMDEGMEDMQQGMEEAQQPPPPSQM